MEILKKLSSILDRGQKIKILGLLILIFIGGLLEMVSASLILPLVSAILDEKSFMDNKYVTLVGNVLKIESARGMLLVMILAIMAAFVIKNGYLIFQTYILARFVNRNRSKCTTNLLWQYLHRPYEFYLYAETADIVRTIYGDMDNIFNLLLQCMNFASEIIVSFCLGIFLLILDPFMTVLVAGLLLLLTLYNTKVIKRYLNTAGEGSRETLAGMYKWILQSVSAVKDIKVLQKEYYFTKKYNESAESYGNFQIRYNVFTNLPRLLIETVAILGILSYVLISLLVGRNIAGLITTLTAFAVAAMRLLPSVNRLNTYMANIAYYEPALNYIYENVNTKGLSERNVLITHRKKKKQKSFEFNNSIELKDITFTYPNTEKYIFENAFMTIPIGSAVGVVGVSGAGKSTIVDILLGLLQLQSGTITVDNVNIMDNLTGYLAGIGYIPQSINMLDDSIRRNIAFGMKDEDIDDNRVWAVLEKAQMKGFVEELPQGLDTSIGEKGVRISGGQRQRLGIARALYHDPELLVFDEATSALDNDTEEAIMEAITELQGHKTLIIIAHRLRTIENCDIIYTVKDGKILKEEKNVILYKKSMMPGSP